MTKFKLAARLVLFVLLSLALVSIATGGTRDLDTPDAKYLAFGKEFPFVVQIVTQQEAPESKPSARVTIEGNASAIVIGARWILTAAHVIQGAETVYVLDDKGAKYIVDTLFVPEGYDEAKVGEDDLALGHLTADFVLEFYPKLYHATDELDKACTIAGFGVTGTFLSGGTLADNKRRAGHNKIDGETKTALFCSPSRGSARYPLEFGITPGDSGGGLFIGNELAGINSFLMASDGKPNGTYGDESAFTRVSAYADWVESQTAKHDQAAK